LAINAGIAAKPLASGGGTGAHVVVAVALTFPHIPLTGFDPSGHDMTTVSTSFAAQSGLHIYYY
jgi:hypothetical protein